MPSKLNKKSDLINRLHVDQMTCFGTDPVSTLCAALYESSKNTRHFYEAMDLIAFLRPETYAEEFKKLDQNL